MAGFGRLLPRSLKALSASAALWCVAAPALADEPVRIEPVRLEPVRLELVLAVDCSSSVNRNEFLLQMEGIAIAFEDPRVLAALAQLGEQGVAVGLLQWSSTGAQVEAIPWTHIGSDADALAFAALIRSTGRVVSGGATALGSAIDAAAGWTQDNGYHGERKVIDVSGDGRSNEGGSPAFARAAAIGAGFTINGLAILNEEPALAGYYVAGVVGGPGSFVLTADDFEDFAKAMRRKLYFEIVGPPVATAPQMAPQAAPQAAPRQAPLLSRLWTGE
jgi:hypothetical protein